MEQTPKHLIGASIPRSGHHFLQNLLTRYFGPQLHYCEFYSPKDCCRSIPCTRRGAFSVIYQKSHDRDMEVPKTIPGAAYVIQYRHPVPEALSDRELDVQDGFGRISLNYRLGRAHYASWLASKAVYYRRFHDKWLASRVESGIYLDYADLSSRPADAVARIAEAATGTVDRGRLDAVVEEARSIRVSTASKAPAGFKPRIPEESPHFDRDLLGAFEDYVISRTPQFGYERMIPEGRFEGHLLQGLVLALDEGEPLPAGHTDRVQAALAVAGEHPDLMIRLAQRDLRAGDAAAAAARLRRVVEAHPYCTAAWKPLLAAHRAAKEALPASLFGGDALLGMAGRPEVLLDAGKALLDAGQTVNAIAALTLCVTFAPGSAKAHHLLANAMLKANRPQQALPHAEAAAEIDPDNAPAVQMLATVRKRLANRKAA